jgi:phosphoglycolate phosphatase
MAFKHIVFDHDGTMVINKQIFEGIKELLELLSSKGIKLYVWTARDRHSTIESLKFHGILKCFEDISTSTDAPFKPSAKGLENMLDFAAKDTVCVIGDSSSDMLGSKSFGSFSIGANWLDGSSEYDHYLKQSGAQIVFSTIEECQEYLISKIE